MYPTVKCPSCGRMLEADGEVALPGVFIGEVHDDNAAVWPVYQCENCVVERTVFGPGTEKFKVCLTFMIGPDGQPYDPAAPDGVLNLSDAEA